jgi:hypothetical protein
MFIVISLAMEYRSVMEFMPVRSVYHTYYTTQNVVTKLAQYLD